MLLRELKVSGPSFSLSFFGVEKVEVRATIEVKWGPPRMAGRIIGANHRTLQFGAAFYEISFESSEP